MSTNDDRHLVPVLELWRSSPNALFGRIAVNLTVSRTHSLLKDLEPHVALKISHLALRRLSQYKAKDIAGLTRAIKNELKARKKSYRQFVVILPLWLTNPPREIRWLGDAPVLRLYKWSSVMRRWPAFQSSLHEYESHRQVRKLPRCSPNNVALFVGETGATDDVEAARRVTEGLWPWRALYHLVTGTTSLQFGPEQEHSIARIPPPLFVGIIDKAEQTTCETGFYSCSIKRAQTLDDKAVEVLRDWRRRMCRTPKMYDYYTATLDTYAQALDATASNERYLMFWQAIETAVRGKDVNGNTNDISSRAAKLVAPSKLVSPVAKALASVRNALVHGGSSVASHPEVIATIQGLANTIVLSALSKCLELKTESALKEYFRLCDDSVDLDAVQRARRLVLESR